MKVNDRTPLLRPAQAAAFLCVSTRTLRRYLRSGALASYRLPSGQVRISTSALEALLERQAKPATRAKKRGPARRECRLPKRVPLTAQSRSGHLFFDTSPETLSALRSAQAEGV
jgi:excisionase family DNA binding protein